MSKVPDPPFTKDAMAKELRELIIIQAGHVAHVFGENALAGFLKFSCDLGWADEPREETINLVNLDDFRIWPSLNLAFDYAFQVGQYWKYSQDEYDEVLHFTYSLTEWSVWGRPVPYHEPNSKVRHVVDLAAARATLDGGYDYNQPIDVRRLSLLANMSEAAVRNSLSASRIASPVEVGVARAWLRDRKGFVPTRTQEGREADWAARTEYELAAERIQYGLAKILQDLDLSCEAAASAAEVSEEELRSLLGEAAPIPISIDKLKRLGRLLKADVPRFAGQATEAILRRLG